MTNRAAIIAECKTDDGRDCFLGVMVRPEGGTGFAIKLTGFRDDWFGPFDTQPDALENGALLFDCDSIKVTWP